jgi:RNA polymerase sigma factor (sigma-70 family)
MSKKSVAEIFSNTSERLLKFIRSRVGSFEDAEDILQDVFYKFIQADNMVKLDPIENTAAWLYRVARNRIIDLRKKKKEESLSTYYNEDDDEYVFEEIADLYEDEAEEIHAAIAELPKEQREVFEMTELLDFSVKEVSELTNTPINTVLSRKHYAVKYLRKKLLSF